MKTKKHGILRISLTTLKSYLKLPHNIEIERIECPINNYQTVDLLLTGDYDCLDDYTSQYNHGPEIKFISDDDFKNLQEIDYKSVKLGKHTMMTKKYNNSK